MVIDYYFSVWIGHIWEAIASNVWRGVMGCVSITSRCALLRSIRRGHPLREALETAARLSIGRTHAVVNIWNSRQVVSQILPHAGRACVVPYHRSQAYGLRHRLLANAILRAIWAENGDISDAATLVKIADGHGLDGANLIEAARSKEMVDEFDRSATAPAAGRFWFAVLFLREGNLLGSGSPAISRRHNSEGRGCGELPRLIRENSQKE